MFKVYHLKVIGAKVEVTVIKHLVIGMFFSVFGATAWYCHKLMHPKAEEFSLRTLVLLIIMAMFVGLSTTLLVMEPNKGVSQVGKKDAVSLICGFFTLSIVEFFENNSGKVLNSIGKMLPTNIFEGIGKDKK